MEYLELAKPWGAAAVAGIGAATAIWKLIQSVIKFNDDHIRKRKFKHYEYLLEGSHENDLKEFINDLRRDELFRTIFGKSISPKKSNALIQMYQTGVFSLGEVITTSKFESKIDGWPFEIKLGYLNKLIMLLDALFCIVYALFAYFTIVAVLKSPSSSNLPAAISIVAITLGFSWFYAKDFRKTHSMFEVKKKMESLTPLE